MRDDHFNCIAFRWLKYIVVMAVTHFISFFLHSLCSSKAKFYSERIDFTHSYTHKILFDIFFSIFSLPFCYGCVSSMREDELVFFFFKYFFLFSAETSSSLTILMLNYPLRIWNCQDLSLSSLSNSVPLICTRVPRRYSIRDPHQHTSK